MEPQCGLTTKAKITRIVDGDTLEIEVKRTFAVRLVHPNEDALEFNTPEKNTTEGKLSKETLEELAEGKDAIIFIPANDGYKLMDIQSFNRILGEVWVDGKLLTQLMLDKNMATLCKKGSYSTRKEK